MKMTLKNSLWVFFFLVLFLGIFRFVYSTVYKDSVSLLKPSHAINNTIKSYVIGDEVGIEKIPRRWGPVSVALIKGIEKFIPKNYEPLVWRLGLFISYGFAIYFFVKLISEFKLIQKKNYTYFWSLIIIVISLQSSAAIYNITNGGSQIITALCIIGHFYFFVKKKYLIASIFIIIGIFYKFHPIIFAFPYFIFAIFSKDHRRYIFCLFFVGAIVSLLSYPIQGLKWGLLYPLSIIYYIIGDQSFSSLPLWSQEVFNPLALINKIINGFQTQRVVFDITPSIKFLASLFSISIFISNLIAGFVLSRLEYRWKHDDRLRFLYLFFFQVVVGFIYLIFSLDTSIEHLLNSSISIFAPIFIFAATIYKFNHINYSNIKIIVIYFFGLSLVGGLLPISIINIVIPYDFADSIVGDSSTALGGYGRFIWYHIPLFGLSIIAWITFISSKNLFKKIA